MPRAFPVLLVAFIAFFIGYAFAQPLTTPQKSVEIVVAGKRYPSLHAYKLQQLKDDLRGVLSSGQLRKFSQEEISTVVQELKTEPPVMPQLPSAKATVSAADARIKQVEEALKNYNARHKDDPSLTDDPARGKTIIIKPSSQDRSSDVQKTDVR